MKILELEDALKWLHQGKPLIYPTETFYGLGVDIFQPEAIESLFQLKQREISKPISILVASVGQAYEVVSQLPSGARELLEQFWPGPTTFVLPAALKLDPRLHAKTNQIGVRQSSHPLAQRLVQEYGRPITTTSANISGQKNPQTVSELQDLFPEKEIALLSGGDIPNSKGSTVVKVVDQGLELIREGDVAFEELQVFFNHMKKGSTR